MTTCPSASSASTTTSARVWPSRSHTMRPSTGQSAANISRDGDWTGWCEFFLQALVAQADANAQRAARILELYNAKKIEMAALTHSQYTIHALDWMFERPIFKSSDFVESAGIPPQTARRILTISRDKGVLKILEAPSGRRPGVYAFAELLNIAEGREIF